MQLPSEAHDDLLAARDVAAELASQGRRVAFSTHPTTGRPVATVREPDGTVRMVALLDVIDPVALRAAVGTRLAPAG